MCPLSAQNGELGTYTTRHLPSPVTFCRTKHHENRIKYRWCRVSGGYANFEYLSLPPGGRFKYPKNPTPPVTRHLFNEEWIRFLPEFERLADRIFWRAA
jgi:hypothetical protein